MPANIFIYSNSSSLTLEQEGRGGLEDDLDDFLASAGHVSGGGGGARGWNIDLELSADEDLEEWATKVAQFLRQWGAPGDTYLKLYPSGWTPGMPEQKVMIFDENADQVWPPAT